MSECHNIDTAKNYARYGLIFYIISLSINVGIGVSWNFKHPVNLSIIPCIFLTSLAYLTYKQIQKNDHTKTQIPLLILGVFGLYLPFGLFFGGIYFLLTYSEIIDNKRDQKPLSSFISTSIDNEISIRNQKLQRDKTKRLTTIGYLFFVLFVIGIAQKDVIALYVIIAVCIRFGLIIGGIYFLLTIIAGFITQNTRYTSIRGSIYDIVNILLIAVILHLELFLGVIYFLLTIIARFSTQDPRYTSIPVSADNKILKRKPDSEMNNLRLYSLIGLLFFVFTTIGIIWGVIDIIQDPPHTFSTNGVRVGMGKERSLYYHFYFQPILIFFCLIYIGLTITSYMAYRKIVKGNYKAAYFDFLFLGSIGLIGSIIFGIFERESLLTNLFTFLNISNMSRFLMQYFSTKIFIITGFPSIPSFLSGIIFLLIYRELGIMLQNTSESISHHK